jgi:hypothetical protein
MVSARCSSTRDLTLTLFRSPSQVAQRHRPLLRLDWTGSNNQVSSLTPPRPPIFQCRECLRSCVGSDTSTLANTAYPSRSSTEFDMSTLGIPDVGGGPSMSHATCILASLRTRLGKRPRGGDETSCTSSGEENSGTTSRPRKKIKGKMAIKRVLVAAGSTSRACQKPITETPIEQNKSKAAERGAGELAAPNVHEVYPRFLLGPSVQGSTVTTVQGAPPQVAGSEQGATWHHVGGTVERQQEAGYEAEDGRPEATEKDHFRIPRRLDKVYKALLEASTEDWARGAVRVLKCRLCPNADFGNWEDYKRHCRFMEAHPHEIVFCDHCGDFFARQDALDRHRRSPPLACVRVSSKMAKSSVS